VRAAAAETRARPAANGRAPDLISEPIRVLFLDVDGVLADGGIWLAEGLELKRFAARDGAAAFVAGRAGLRLVIVTFRESEAVKRRAEELQIQALQGVRDKGRAVAEALAALDIPPRAAAFMGDDLVDLAAMRQVGLAIAPRDAAPPALGLAQLVTSAPGGEGAVREAIEVILWLNRALSERRAARPRRSPARTSAPSGVRGRRSRPEPGRAPRGGGR
jgi:3-deoxy-D-manno-octulosonate 8-phosphate phosphatase (KDO 8-P phosphatase)